VESAFASENERLLAQNPLFHAEYEAKTSRNGAAEASFSFREMSDFKAL
jgi:hypothetical protein